ncbi:MAG: hypothetical protein MJY79_00500 [Bacteroidaceae bacterium]|nr:hypothetical protein [Bacteroidaceae bacterium]
MNAASIIIIALILVLLVIAIRHYGRHGSENCSGSCCGCTRKGCASRKY